jgi:tetratricopeptide (TPR) repeat protein
LGKWFLAALTFIAWSARNVAADDAVYLAAGGNSQARAKIPGQILDYNGRELVLKTPGGEKRYPTDQVVDVDTEWTPVHLAADELFDRREYAAALSKYEESMRGESRRWVQRRIVAQMIWCLRNVDQYRRAADLFLALAKDDPAMLYFACIPLRWLPGQPTAELDKKSREWLASDLPPATLIGASHLLSTGDRAAIVARLEKLADSKNARVAALARALMWSATFTSATSKQLQQWSRDIEKFPDAVRAGPYFVLGRALLQHQQPEDAALNLLHVPLLYADDRTLAATALCEAGHALEQAKRPDGAARLYRELLGDYPDSRPAADAQQRLKDIDAKPVAPAEGD